MTVTFDLVDATYKSLLETVEKSVLPGQQVQLDQMQGDALHKAITKPFCVIQGVAGAGKTLLLARQAYMYTQVNRKIYEVSESYCIVCNQQVIEFCRKHVIL